MAVSQTYSQIGNAIQVLDLVKRSMIPNKREILAEYYAELGAIWQEIDLMRISSCLCSDCAPDAMNINTRLINSQFSVSWLA